MTVPTVVHEAMAARVASGELPGIVTVVDRDDDATVDAIGVTAFGGDVPMRPDTVFRIASMTKPIVAALTLVLAEDDLLDLEEPAHRLLPELAGRRVLRRPDGPLDDTVAAHRPVTVEDLLTFKLGFGVGGGPDLPIDRAWRDAGLVLAEPDPRTELPPDEWIRRFAELPLRYQPGERWSYNVGTAVLGVLLARAAKQDLGELLRERLLEPLGMGRTGFWLADAELPAYYRQGEDRTARTPDEVWRRPPVFPSGSGGLLSTAGDLLAFARMLRAGGVHGGTRLLSEASVRRMTTNHLTPEQIAGGGDFLGGSGWGLGLAVTTEPDEISGPGRYGWAGGYGTTWFTDPGTGTVGIALTQVADFLMTGGLTEFERLANAKGTR